MPACVLSLGAIICSLPNAIADPVNITSVSRTQTGHFLINGNTIYPIGNLIVEATADLGTSFAPLGVATPMGGGGGFQYDDATATGLPKRFYRLVHPTTGGIFDVQPPSVNFGLVCCGDTAAPQSITISNPGSNSFTFFVQLTSGAERHTLSAPGGSVGPGESFPLTITPAAIPAVSETTPNLYGGELTISTSIANDPSHVVQITQTARGARLTTAPTSLNFGTVLPGQSRTLPLLVANDGNISAAVMFMSSNSVFTILPTSATIPGGGSASETARFSPTQFGHQTGTLTLSLPMAPCLCAPVPSVSMQGN